MEYFNHSDRFSAAVAVTGDAGPAVATGSGAGPILAVTAVRDVVAGEEVCPSFILDEHQIMRHDFLLSDAENAKFEGGELYNTS